MSNRALIIQALGRKPIQIEYLSDARDTKILARIMHQLKFPEESRELNAEDAGTVMRFMTAYLSLQTGREFVLSGTARAHERPIAILVNALRSLGAQITYLGEDGYPPLLISGRNLHGDLLEIDGHISSQFISAICMISPCLPQGLTIQLKGEPVSRPYVDMTLQMMTRCGIEIWQKKDGYQILPGSYLDTTLQIERDWSSAAFFLLGAALSEQAELRFEGLFHPSLQGDHRIMQILSEAGMSFRFDFAHATVIKPEGLILHFNSQYDFTDAPDLAVPFIVFCALGSPQTTITGIRHLEWKESKRLTALIEELAKIGFELYYKNDVLHFSHSIPDPTKCKPVMLRTYADHRLAMSFSLLRLAGYPVSLDQPSTVSKSFPGFFKEWHKLGIVFS